MAKRSYDEVLVAYFLAKFETVGRDTATGKPPRELNVKTWRRAYELFWPGLGGGRTTISFARSVKASRDLFDAHLQNSRVGWRVGGSERLPKPLSGLELRVWTDYSDTSREDVWRSVRDLISHSNVAEPELESEESEVDFRWIEVPDDDPHEREIRAIKVRRGQSVFRRAILQLYGRKCAVTQHGPPDILEAAHVEPHSARGRNDLANGILLRADIHTLFDLGLMWIHPDTRTVELHPRLRNTPYEVFDGKRIARRVDGSDIAVEYLRARFEQRSRY